MPDIDGLTWGDAGPTILLAHGGGDSAGTWDAIGPRLAHLGHVVAPDLLGHGRSARLPPDVGPGGPADLHSPLLDVVGDDPLVYVGHSLGAPVVLALARLRPPKGVVLVDGAPHRRIFEPPESLDLDDLRARYRDMGFGAIRTADEVEAAAAASDEPAATRRSHAPRPDGTFERRPDLDEIVRLAQAGVRHDNPYRDLTLYADVTVPTIALCATRGTAADVRPQVDALVADNPRIELQWLDASHRLHWDRPDAVVDVVERLLA